MCWQFEFIWAYTWRQYFWNLKIQHMDLCIKTAYIMNEKGGLVQKGHQNLQLVIIYLWFTYPHVSWHPFLLLWLQIPLDGWEGVRVMGYNSALMSHNKTIQIILNDTLCVAVGERLTLEFVSCIVGHLLNVIGDCLQVILCFWEWKYVSSGAWLGLCLWCTQIYANLF